MEEDIQVD